jgi:hypothetical protein
MTESLKDTITMRKDLCRCLGPAFLVFTLDIGSYVVVSRMYSYPLYTAT